MKTPPPPTVGRRVFGYAPNSAALLVGAFAVFLLFRPYQGIIHDARLYVGYAMAAIDPDGIGRDIVFVNDGQSKFSVYPLLMRSLAEWIGPSRAAIVLTYGGLALWFAAFAALVRRLVDERMGDTQVAAVIVLAASLPAFYGGQGVFRVAEFYATPRAFAEACVLASLAAILAQRTSIGMGALVIGLAFHPLMTAPGIGIALWYRAEAPRARRVLTSVAVGATMALVVGTLSLEGMGKPFVRFDAEWMQALEARHALVFIRNWRTGDAIRIVVQLVTVLLALPALNRQARRLAQSTLVVIGAGLVFSLIGADGLSNVLVTQAQAWRGLWLLSTLATVMLGVLLWSVWSAVENPSEPSAERDLRRAATLLLVLAWSMVEINSTGLLFASLAVLLWRLPKRLPSFSLPPRGLNAIGGLTIVILLLTVGVQSWINLTTAWASPDTTMRWSLASLVMTGIPALATCALAAIALWGRLPSWPPAQARERLWITLAILAVVASSLDSRSRYQEYVEGELDARAEGVAPSAIFAKGETILWPYADLEPWALAGSAGWGTIVQGIPAVFDRVLAIEWDRRNEVIRAAGLLPEAQTRAETIGTLDAVVDSRTVRAACGGRDSPDVVAVPDVQLHSVYSTSAFQLSDPRILYPRTIGERWERIDRYRLVDCAEVKRTR